VARIELKGVHRVRRKLANGTYRERHYAWRGGPCFWSSDMSFPKHGVEYIAAFSTHAARPTEPRNFTKTVVDQFLDSAEFLSTKPRTQKDYKKWMLRFQEEFSDDPFAMFAEPESRGEVSEWRQQWAHSPKQFDYCGTVVTRFLNWAENNGKISRHFCHKLPKVYEADRAEIVWTPADVDLFCQAAPEYARRILICACETGLRPGDLAGLNRGHIHETRHGRRLRVRTNKRSKIATIPVSQKLAALLDTTPSDRMLILVGDKGQKLDAESASKAVSRWRNRIPELTPEAKGFDLRLYDARGTAATRLLEAGLGLNDIASYMGWSIRYASQVIEHYAVISEDETDRVKRALEAAQKAKNGTKL
jgi:integrase